MSKKVTEDIVIPFVGGTIKFLHAIDYIRKNGTPGHLNDRIEIYGDTRTPATLTPGQFHTMLEAIQNRDDVRAWLETLVEQ